MLLFSLLPIAGALISTLIDMAVTKILIALLNMPIRPNHPMLDMI